MSGTADRERLEALARTGLTPAPDEALDRFARIVRTHLRVPVALVSMVEADRQIFPGLIGLGGWAGESRETPLSHSFCQHVVDSGEPLVIADARQDGRVSDNLAIRDLGVIAYAGMPLVDSAGRVLGSLCAIDTEPRQWTEPELSALRDLADACSGEIRSREIVHDAQAARAAAQTARARAEAANARLTVLAELSRTLVSSLVPAETLDRLTALLVPEIADWAMVFLLDDDGAFVGPGIGRHRDPQRADDVAALAALHPRHASETSLIRRVVSTGDAVFEPEVRPTASAAGTTAPEVPAIVERLGLASIMVVPMRGRSGTVGTLLLSRGPASEPFDRQDLLLAKEIGRWGGITLENATLYGKQTRTSEALQRSMLTRIPEPDNLRIVARYLPAAHEVEVGGDWYDSFRQPDGSNVLVIGDVVGHDMTAAAAMGQVRNLLRGTTYDRDESPAQGLSRVDAAIAGLPVDTMATAVVVRLDSQQDRSGLRFRWSNAGHPPPMLVGRDGVVDVLADEPDLMLGVDPGTGRRDHDALLVPGSVLFLYTDGLIERRDSSLAAGIDRLAAVLSGAAGSSLESVCDSVLADLRPGDTEDDIAILAVRIA